MNRLLALAMTTLMLISMLTGCGSAESSAAADNNKVYQVAIIQLVTHDALDAATQGFQDALVAELGEGNVNFDLQNAAGDTNTCAAGCRRCHRRYSDLRYLRHRIRCGYGY